MTNLTVAVNPIKAMVKHIFVELRLRKNMITERGCLIMMTSKTTRFELENKYKNFDRNSRKMQLITEPKSIYSLKNDKDYVMPLIKMMYAVYKQAKTC